MMPRATYAVPDYKPLSKWTVIVAAVSIDGKYFIAGLQQQNLLTTNMAE